MSVLQEEEQIEENRMCVLNLQRDIDLLGAESLSEIWIFFALLGNLSCNWMSKVKKIGFVCWICRPDWKAAMQTQVSKISM